MNPAALGFSASSVRRLLHSPAPATATAALKTKRKTADNMNPAWSVRAVSVPGPDSDTALYVSFDEARFLFGAGEGTQRSFLEKRTKLAGVGGVFLPGGAKGRNGLPGELTGS